MALLKTPLYLCTRVLAGPPELLPASTRACRGPGGGGGGGWSSSLLPSLRPGKPRRQKAARKEAAEEQWGAPGGEGAPAAHPPAPPPPGPAPAASCGLARRSAGERGPPPAGSHPARSRADTAPGVTYGSLAGARPATGRPPLTLGEPASSAPRCRGHPRVYSLSRSPPNCAAPGAERAAGRVGLPGWLAASPAPEPIPGSAVRTGRPMGALNPPLAAPGLLPPAPRPPVPSHAMSTTRRRGGSTTDAPRPRRCSVRLFPSGDGAAHGRRLSIVLLPDPQIPFSPPQKPPGVGNGKTREGRRRGNKLPPRQLLAGSLAVTASPSWCPQPACPRQPATRV